MPNVLRDELRRGQYRPSEDRTRGDRSTPYKVYGHGRRGSTQRSRYEQEYDRNRDMERSYDTRGYGGAREYEARDYDMGYYDTGYYDTGFEEPGYTEYVEEWYIPGPFTGIGPTSYHRSDENILEDVSERLMQHGLIDARGMTVTVDNGEVTLEGAVNSRREKRMAEDTAESVTGVTDVHNRLRVKKAETETSGQM